MPAPAIVSALRRLGLLDRGEDAALTPLSGGVSSDIWRVDLPDRTVAAKQALPTLKVQAVWEAPVERSRYEAAWLDTAARLAPGLGPALIGYDPIDGVVVMEWLDPADHPVWKGQLRDGHADAAVAATLATGLVQLHTATADRADVEARFDSGYIFGPIRLEPYLDATGRVHPDLDGTLAGLRAMIEANRRVLVHGDVSPKNVLVGPRGPVLIDAECATFSDPAFDLAFCLNHLLLKCLWNPSAAARFLACFTAFAAAYLGGVAWEATSETEARATRLLPALLLARVDGKSPVEYLDSVQQDQVRETARAMLIDPPGDTLASIRERWHACLR